MSHRSTVTPLLCAALLASACEFKAPEPPSAIPIASAPARPLAPAPAKPPAPAPARTFFDPALIGDDTLSVIEQVGEECKWVRLDVGQETRQELLSFEDFCRMPIMLAWSHDGRRGAFLQPYGARITGRAWTPSPDDSTR